MENETTEKPKQETSKEVKVPEEGLIKTVDAYRVENDRREVILKREEELAARRLLGGETTHEEPPKPKEETDKEYAERMARGGV